MAITFPEEGAESADSHPFGTSGGIRATGKTLATLKREEIGVFGWFSLVDLIEYKETLSKGTIEVVGALSDESH